MSYQWFPAGKVGGSCPPARVRLLILAVVPVEAKTYACIRREVPRCVRERVCAPADQKTRASRRITSCRIAGLVRSSRGVGLARSADETGAVLI
jgi:hypothetical protein